MSFRVLHAVANELMLEDFKILHGIKFLFFLTMLLLLLSLLYHALMSFCVREFNTQLD